MTVRWCRKARKVRLSGLLPFVIERTLTKESPFANEKESLSVDGLPACVERQHFVRYKENSSEDSLPNRRTQSSSQDTVQTFVSEGAAMNVQEELEHCPISFHPTFEHTTDSSHALQCTINDSHPDEHIHL